MTLIFEKALRRLLLLSFLQLEVGFSLAPNDITRLLLCKDWVLLNSIAFQLAQALAQQLYTHSAAFLSFSAHISYCRKSTLSSDTHDDHQWSASNWRPLSKKGFTISSTITANERCWCVLLAPISWFPNRPKLGKENEKRKKKKMQS